MRLIFLAARAPQADSKPEAGDSGPAWSLATVDRRLPPDPLFLATKGLSKGQVFLNGQAMGRYWSIGPNHSVYLPGMLEHDTLVILDEEGKSPKQTYVFRDNDVPATTTVL